MLNPFQSSAQLTSAELSFMQNLSGLSYAQGDILYYNGTSLTRLPAGTSGQFLKTLGAGANPLWDTIAGGGDLLSTNNLSDISNDATAVHNLFDATAFTAATVAGTDKVLIQDTDGSDVLKTVTAQSIADLGNFAPPLGVDDNYVTDAEKIVIGNTSGTNTGDNAINTLYSGLVTNATHTGEVTGSGALTLDKTAISNKVDTVITASDVILFGDATDTGNLKSDTVQGILDLVPAAPTRASLGLDTTDSPMFTGINLGHASDTTMTRVSAGVVAIEGVNISMAGHTHSYLANVVEDVTPQLGGNLDTNGNNIVIDDTKGILDENSNEQLIFQTVASATNYLEIYNSATGGKPVLLATGSDTDVGLTLETKGAGSIVLGADTEIQGDFTLGENSIKLDPTLSGDATASGITQVVTSGSAFSEGDICFLASDGKWDKTDGILDGTDTAFKSQLGIALATASGVDESIEMLLYGKVRSASFPAFTVGAPVYMDDTAGDVVVTQPSTTNFAIRIVGYALTAEDLMFAPSPDYIVHV